MARLNMLKMIGLLVLLLIALALPSVLPKDNVVQQEQPISSGNPPNSTT